MNFVRLNASDQNSKLTDEEFSQILSKQKEYSYIKVYMVYFICYGIMEVLSVLMVAGIGSISWLILRCLFTALMLGKKTRWAATLVGMIDDGGAREMKDEADEEIGRRRQGDLFQKMM